MSTPALNDLPHVPMSVFKANPSAYSASGALVMVHNRPTLRVLPASQGVSPRLDEIKAELRLLNDLVDHEAAQQEMAELAAERDADRLGEAL